ncbi:Proton glutamate symport protein [Phycisphaerae bacterium RAS1]|nr:Proton glutamate symport protein [Phycisphaerae bacterium RAS1]
MSSHPLPRSDSGPSAAPRRIALHWKILIALLLGIGGGLTANLAAPRAADGGTNPTLAWIADYVAYPIGQVFLRLIFMVVVPLVFAALVLGVAEMGDMRRLGRVGLRTLLLTLVLSTISVGIGITLVNSIRPGASLTAEKRDELRSQFAAGTSKTVEQAGKARTIRDSLLDFIPKNPLQEMVGAIDGSSPGGGMIAVMFFALIFGAALTLIPPDRAAPLINVLQGLLDVCLTLIALAMRLAPLGVAALVFNLAAVLGLDVLRTLLAYMLTVVIGLALQMLVVYGVTLAALARRSPFAFFMQASEAILTAFATSSSNAALPTALRVAETRLRIRPQTARFVLTVGATANQNGTALFEGVTVLFLAQLFGVSLSMEQQVTVAFMAIVAGIGTAGVPGGSLPLVAILLQQVNVPVEGIGVILGADRILDMCRTTVNVAGDLTIAACVDRSEASGCRS